MRIFAILLLSFSAIVDLAFAQTIDVAPSLKGELPMFRPVLLGTGPGALINKIDTADLIKKGQKDAAIMFSCSILKNGDIAWSGTYRGTPNSKLLEQELRKHIAPAGGLKFIPAVYDHQLVDAIYYGTVTFAVVDDKPRLRIFSNQETAELEKENDFIGPQPFFGGESGFDGLHYPSSEDAPVQLDGVAEIGLKIGEKGNLQKIKMLREEPSFVGFGEAAVADFGKAKFIPAFRDGKPVACEVTLPVYYKAKPNF